MGRGVDIPWVVGPLYFEPPDGKLTPHFYQKRGVHNTTRQALTHHG